MKKSIKDFTNLYTHPVFIVGSYDLKDMPNILAVSWGGVCCSEPPCIAVSVRPNRHSYAGMMENKAFTVNIPNQSQAFEANYTGHISGKKENKFETLGLTAVDAGIVKAPYIKEFPMNIICELIKTVEIGVHTQFIGQVKDVKVSEEYLNEKGKVDIHKLKPIIYDTATRSYFGIGEKIWEAKNLKK